MTGKSMGASNGQVQYSTFFVNNIYCGIDITMVQEINEDNQITEVPLAPDYVVGIMNLRGQIVTVVDPGLKIGLGRIKICEDNHIIIVSSKEEHIGLIVDAIGDVVSTPTDKIKVPPSNLQGAQGEFFEGVVHTKGGELLAVLDVAAILT